MNKVKQFFKTILAYWWQFFKSSFPAAMMYFCAGTAMLLLSTDGGENFKWNNEKLVWTIICTVVAVGYNGLAMWGIGGGHYDMLVTGNVKRMSSYDVDGGYKMSRHKYVQEYRPWKGFVIGAFIGFFMIYFGIVFGIAQKSIDTNTQSRFVAAMMLLSFIFSGASFFPFYCLNQSGIYVSYYWGCACAIVPIVVTGVFYILGAYRKRNKKIREQIIADRMAQEEAKREKKINYGGLPGTKPKKRK